MNFSKNLIGSLIFLAGAASAATPVEELTKRGYPASPEGIVLATERQDIPAINLFLQAKVSINAANRNKKSPIHAAAESSNTELLNFVLAKGGDKNAQMADGSTPLLLAVKGKKRGSVKTLLAAQANPNLPTDSTPLAQAIETDEVDIAEMLIKGGADVNLNPVPVLAYSIVRKNRPTFDLLIRYKADVNRTVNSKDEGKISLLRLAFARSELGMAEVLLNNKADPNWIDDNGISEARFLVKLGLSDGVAVLGRYKFDVDERFNGKSLLEDAIRDNKKYSDKTVLTLINLGADVKNQDLIAPMFVTCLRRRECDLEIVADMVDRGADVKSYRFTDEKRLKVDWPIMQAALDIFPLADPNTERMLIGMINAGAYTGVGPDRNLSFVFRLYEAIARSRIENPNAGIVILDALIKSGMDINTRNSHRTLLGEAQVQNLPAVVSYLKSKGACLEGNRLSSSNPADKYCSEQGIRPQLRQRN